MSVRGLLQLTLKSANDLHKHDLFGKQQPYCQIDCGRFRVKCKTCKDGGQNPTWGETMFFQVSAETEVLVTVFAEHSLSKDTPIGAAVISIVQVRQTGSEDVSVPITLKGKQAGTLHVTMEFKGPSLAAYGQVGTAYGQVAQSGDSAGGRRALQGSRPSIFGSASSSFSASTGTGQLQPLQLASMPIRLLQQQGSSLLQAQQQHAAAVSSYTPSQQQQSPRQQPFAGGLQPSTSVPQQLGPQQSQQSQDAALEARELLLQRQLSAPVMPADMAALQQLYSQQLQQLQLLQTQLLGNLPVELQQQNLVRQQLLLSHIAMQRTGSASSQQHDGLQQRGSRGGGGGGSSTAATAALQLPKQPKRTAADLFLPDSAGMNSSSAASFGQMLDGAAGLGDDDLLNDESDMLLSDGTSVPFSFNNMARLQAIIQKVYPDRNISSIWGQANKPSADTTQARSQGADAFTATATSTAATTEDCALRQGSTPSSTGAFGTAAALEAAAAAAGIELDSKASGRPLWPSATAVSGYNQQALGTPPATAAKPTFSHSSIPTSTGAFGAAAALAAAAAAAGIESDGMPGSTRKKQSSDAAGATAAQNTKLGSSLQTAGGQPVQQSATPSSAGAFGTAAALAAAAAAAAGMEGHTLPLQAADLQSHPLAVTSGAEHSRAATQPGAATAASGPPSQEGFAPNSTGAFGTAAALAAALAATVAGLTIDSTACEDDKQQTAAAAAAGVEASSAGTVVQPSAGSAGTLAAGQHLQQQQQPALETSYSAVSAQSAPPAFTTCSIPGNLVSTNSGRSTSLQQVVSAPTMGLPQGMLGAEPTALSQQHQQLALSPDVSAVLAEELVRLKAAAPVLAQLLGLGTSQSAEHDAAAATADAAVGASTSSSNTTGQQIAMKTAAKAAPLFGGCSVGEAAAAAATAPPTPSPAAHVAGPAAAAAQRTSSSMSAAASGSSSNARSAEELAWLLEAAEKDKANLTRQLQESGLQVQQLYYQLSQQQQEVQRLQQWLSQQQPHH